MRNLADGRENGVTHLDYDDNGGYPHRTNYRSLDPQILQIEAYVGQSRTKSRWPETTSDAGLS